MAEILTKQEIDMKAYRFYQERIKAGRQKTQAVYDTMAEFSISAPITIYRINKRCEALLAAKKQSNNEE